MEGFFLFSETLIFYYICVSGWKANQALGTPSIEIPITLSFFLRGRMKRVLNTFTGFVLTVFNDYISCWKKLKPIHIPAIRVAGC
jgi:hypothetical protein